MSFTFEEKALDVIQQVTQMAAISRKKGVTVMHTR